MALETKTAEAAHRRRFERYAWATLAFTIAVIVWGAVVRATGSGAGCGNHWPLCNGDVVPFAPRTATIIEYAHRLTSGVLLVVSVALAGLAWRWFPRGHLARRGAALSLIFVLFEAAIGAGIVLLQLVEENASALRAGYIGVHLVNTMLLAAAMTLMVWAARPRVAPAPGATGTPASRLLGYALVALLAVSAAGAVVALGDTLFPQASLRAGFAADFDPASSFLIRLRMWHPVLAVATAFYLVTVLVRANLLDDPAVRRPARLAVGFLAAQLGLGAANVFLLAPLWLQMAHLLVGNLLWVAVVWLWLTTRAWRAARWSLPGPEGPGLHTTIRGSAP